ncbi:flagellar basal-body rod protein FlgG [Caenibius tardaugens NBRC 16725]|uniref:Flagellar basal-body rod protein FlgG n=1 Tax=Caenibius tardaugens NBRC 16725 TaxID=1219035 RepID=U2YPC8_9SPHN|nr:flagellar hook basal-body protein [Caenibius tardaugens]AZI36413.1 flagellar hook basal-body protein [Caenibius tardaugens NBRC 16725]GAD50775.1 flagellar basal-body rod protein FlgG [Caenibius tardaugens NBRC 16725]
MNGAFEVGAVALRADQKALELLANNIANVNTPAFKRSDARFSAILANQTRDDGTPAAVTGDNLLATGGVRIAARAMLFSQGEIRPTGNPLDLAIDGQGFIELMGPGGQTLLWRGGTLRVNEDGALVTLDGLPLHAGITVPADATRLTISAEGMVKAEGANGEVVELGQIGLVRADHEDMLEQLDGGLLRAADNARLTDALPGEDGAGRMVQGALEGANVELTEEMVQMLVIQRAFAANAQALQTADQLAAITNNLKK